MYNQLTLRHITLTLILSVGVISSGNALRAKTSYMEEGILFQNLHRDPASIILLLA